MRMIESRLVKSHERSPVVFIIKNLSQKYQVRDISAMTQPVIGEAFSLIKCNNKISSTSRNSQTQVKNKQEAWLGPN